MNKIAGNKPALKKKLENARPLTHSKYNPWDKIVYKQCF